MSRRGYRYQVKVLSTRYLPWAKLARIYADAAAWLERTPDYDAEWAIAKATDRMSFTVGSMARFIFRENFGAWTGDAEGVTMLCFASALAGTGDL